MTQLESCVWRCLRFQIEGPRAGFVWLGGLGGYSEGIAWVGMGHNIILRARGECVWYGAWAAT